VANPQGDASASSGGSEKEPPDTVITIKLPGIVAGRDTINSIMARKSNFYHTDYLVVSEEMARSEEFFSLVESLIREREISRKTNIIITKEKASEFINSEKSQTESRKHKYYEFMTRRAEQTALVPTSTIHKFLQKTEADEETFLGIYGTSKKAEPKQGYEDQYKAGEISVQGDLKTQIIGSAVFKEGKMIGILTGEETKLSLVLMPNFQINSIMATYKDPINKHKIVTAKTTETKTKVKVDLKSKEPTIKVTTFIDVDIDAIPSTINYVTDKDNRKLLEEHIAKGLEKKFDALIKRTQKEFKAEPFRWAPVARRKFLTIQDYSDFDWMKTYPKMKVIIDVQVTLKGFGKQLAPPEYEKTKD